MKRKLCVMSAIVAAALSATDASAQTVLFKSDTVSTCYRIPALTKAKDGSIFAFTDFRPCRTDVGGGVIDVVAKRSTDNGRTWSKEQTVVKGGGENIPFDVAHGDAAVVTDRKTGEMLMMCASGNVWYWQSTLKNPNRVGRYYSKDGFNWKGEEITDQIKHTALWLVGSATTGGWDLGKATMILPSDDNPMVFRGTVDLLEGEMKIAVNKYTGYGQTFYQRDAADDTKMTFGGDDNKWNISKAGQYDVEADVKNLTISIVEHVANGITNMATTANATADYFTLSGVRLSAPAKGICIKRQGNRVVKTINRK